jgi:hypothetical protein
MKFLKKIRHQYQLVCYESIVHTHPILQLLSHVSKEPAGFMENQQRTTHNLIEGLFHVFSLGIFNETSLYILKNLFGGEEGLGLHISYNYVMSFSLVVMTYALSERGVLLIFYGLL